ncbi:MAG: DHA2 family efflux MFS transporter permease subunit [Thermoleophilia bacterium]|nr:DHA2 family efflux MFS transporter permease subunit [Thermoleophilia bacterium]
MALGIFSEERRKWWTLAAVAFGLFMIMLDNTVVNVALPAIQEDLAADLSQLQWIVTGYALSFAALMLIGGKLADAYGRRLIFVVGIVVFTAASLWCGLADSGELLIAARVIQGVGAALMNPATLSIIAATFPPRERGMAIGIWAGVSALALAIGPLVGGLLTEHLSWHWIFFVNVPVGVVAIAASFLLITESKDETHESLDLPGLAASGLGLFALTYGLIEANGYGWTSARIVGSFVVAVVALVGFVVIERRRRAPMLDLTLFRSGTYAGANLAMLLVALAMFGVFFFVSLYMQNVLGYSAVQAGAAFLPMTLIVILVAPIAGKASDRFGSRWLMTVGMVLLGVQLLYLSQLGTDATFWSLLPGFVVGGLGMSMTMTPTAAAATRAVPVHKAGVGSAVLNAMRQVGGSVGIALMGAIVAHEASGRPSLGGFMAGYQRALEVAALIAFVGSIVAFALVRQEAHHEPAAVELAA